MIYLDPSGQILQLCDQISRQNSQQSQPVNNVNNLPGPTSSGFVTNVQPHIQNTFPQQPQQPQQQPLPPPTQFSNEYFFIVLVLLTETFHIFLFDSFLIYLNLH